MPVGSSTVLLDANLLLLLVIGGMDSRMIATFKRTSTFTVQDYKVLSGIVERAAAVITTPHILTETSNLANALHYDQREQFTRYFAFMIASLDERHTSAGLLSKHPLFRFGIADVSMMYTEATLILTEDGRFASLINDDGRSLALNLKSAAALQERLL